MGLNLVQALKRLSLKKINDCIKRLFKIKPSDRHSIVKQTISLSRDNQPTKKNSSTRYKKNSMKI
ncbi:hypothetical protein TUM17384_13710 [Shewanella algae]|nr:hypothetical protein TUM17384_13710 [Shewanella algae]